MQENKVTLRNYFNLIRSRLSVSERQAAAAQAAMHFAQSLIFRQSQHIACYFPIQSEINTEAIIHEIWKNKKDCYLPVLSKLDSKQLTFHAYRVGDNLVCNQYDIPEPILSPQINPEELDLVILPLVAFDKNGYRLGTGGGYYDYTFAFLQHQIDQKPFLMGVAYAVQESTILPADSWDIRLNAILTEKGMINVSSEKS